MEMISTDTRPVTNNSGPRKVDLTKGTTNASVSNQWWSRPLDERFLSVNDLQAFVHGRRDRYSEFVTETNKLQFLSSGDNDIRVIADGQETEFTNWSMSQICSQLRVPFPFLQRVPAVLGAMNLQTLAIADRAPSKFLLEKGVGTGGIASMRAVTTETYGRIYDADVVDQVQRITERGNWKVPGTMHWGTGVYDPSTPVTAQTTTLFASDRDVFMFLCDDEHPIEVGKTKNGDPDLMFRGFIVRNSEVGRAKFVLNTMYLRAVCCNRMLWGVENFTEFSMVHRSGAPTRFAEEVMPALDIYAGGDPMKVVDGVRRAKAAVLARGEEAQLKLLTDMGFSQVAARDVVKAATTLEGSPPETAWDFAQGLTAAAQDLRHGDDRFEMEIAAGKILEGVKV